MDCGIERKRTALVLAAGLFVAPAAWAGSPTIVSTFDTDLEGWTAQGLLVDTGNLFSPLSLQENPTDIAHDAGAGAFGGNPGGFAHFLDDVDEPGSFASAPAAFLGDLSGYIGGTFSFEHRLFDEGSDATSIAPYAIAFLSGDPGDVGLGNLNLDAYVAIFPGPDLGDADTGWVEVSAELTSGNMTPINAVDLGLFDVSLAGQTAGDFGLTTNASFEDVMSDVTHILLSFELVDNNSTQTSEDGGIDNVRLEAIPEPGSLVLLGLAGLALVRRRRD